jgi:ATP-binding cassette, subfamily B, bacterial
LASARPNLDASFSANGRKFSWSQRIQFMVRRPVVSVAALSTTSLMAAALEAVALVIIARAAIALSDGKESVSVDLPVLGRIEPSLSTLVAWAAGSIAILLLCHLLIGWLVANIEANAVVHIRDRVMESFLRANWAAQSAIHEGRMHQLVTDYANNIARLILLLITAFISAVSFLILAGAAVIVSPLAAATLAVFVLLLTLIVRPISAMVRRQSAIYVRKASAHGSFVAEISQLPQDIRIFGVTDNVFRELRRKVRDARRNHFRARLFAQMAQSGYRDGALLILVGGIGAVVAIGAGRVATLGIVVLLLVRALSYAQQVNATNQQINTYVPYLDDLMTEVKNLQLARVPQYGTAYHASHTISFRNVGFEYAPGIPVLQDIDFELHAGEVVGIIGPSGSGKSTLIQLLLRLREPTRGAIYADGLPVKDVSLKAWYRDVAFVGQDPRLFSGTIEENIAFFRGVDTSKVRDAAKAARLEPDIQFLSSGYHTFVRGALLSGGQRQRLVIARALLGAPTLLVLDEPTSALDAESEHSIQETLTKLRGRTTVVIIAHRLSTLSVCDRIMVLVDGRIREFAQPDVLLNESKYYNRVLKLSGLR